MSTSMGKIKKSTGTSSSSTTSSTTAPYIQHQEIIDSILRKLSRLSGRTDLTPSEMSRKRRLSTRLNMLRRMQKMETHITPTRLIRNTVESENRIFFDILIRSLPLDTFRSLVEKYPYLGPIYELRTGITVTSLNQIISLILFHEKQSIDLLKQVMKTGSWRKNSKGFSPTVRNISKHLRTIGIKYYVHT